MIRLLDLTKKYGQKVAVESLSMDVSAGCVTGFLGPNGAGKTTTLRMVVGLLQPSSGQIRFEVDDQKLSWETDALRIRSLTGFVPDSPHLYEKLTGQEHLDLIADLYNLPYDHTERYVRSLTEPLILVDHLKSPVESYSHGMRQKLVLACALLPQPRFLVVDEPMVGLDPASARTVKKLFRQQAEEYGATVLISTHSLDLVEEICDDVAIIRKGRLVTSGPKAELMSQPDHRLEDVFLRLTEEA